MNRLPQLTLLISLLAISWLAMQLVHEFGHVLAAYATGGAVPEVIFHPLTISRTHVEPNPKPLIVAWAGAIFGSLAPALAALLAHVARSPAARYLNFFAGFCLLANGVYIGCGALEGVGDAGELLRLESPIALPIAFGITASAAGLYLWHITSPEFGFGRAPRAIKSKEAAIAAAIAIVVIACASIFGVRD